MEKSAPLPYTDIKPVGAADFYFAINATFRFIFERFGEKGLREYWTELGQSYFAPVAKSWKDGGLPAVAKYWRAFFAAEPGAEVETFSDENSLILNVKSCSAIRHLRDNRREILPCFCQHCYFVSEATAQLAGLTVRIEGGNGVCRQTFLKCKPGLPPQDLAKITEVK